MRLFGWCFHTHTRRERISSVLHFICDDCDRDLGPVVTRDARDQAHAAQSRVTAVDRMVARVKPKRAARVAGVKRPAVIYPIRQHGGDR